MVTTTKQLAIMTGRASETAFYRYLADNSTASIRNLCMKVPRKMLYKYLADLNRLQTYSELEIFEKTATINPITGLPNTAICRKCEMDLKRISEETALVIIREITKRAQG